jgi:outer membrane receptor protein involved in Fe transport
LTANGFGDLSGWVTAGRRSEGGGALAGLDLRRAEGWRDHSERDIGNVLLRGWRSAGQGRIEGGLALHSARWDSPGFLSLAEFGQGDFESAADQTDGGNQSRVVAHGRYATPIGPRRFLQLMGWGLVSDLDLFLTTPGHEDAFGNLYQSSESDRRWGAGTEAELSWMPSSHEVTVGVSLRTDRSEYDKNRTLRRSPIDGEVAVDAEHTAAGLYVRWRKTIMDRLGLDLGARVDHLRYRSFNRLGLEELEGPEAAASMAPAGAGTRVGDIIILEPGPAVFHIIGDQGPVGEWVRGDQTIVSPKLGARFSLTDRVTLTASSSRGFRSAVGVLGDPDRPPFLAWAQELGIEYATPRLDSRLSLFRTDVTNERIQDPITLAISSAGSSVRQGVEVDVDVEAGRGIVLSGRGTYTDARLSGRYADAHHDHGDDGSTPDATPPEEETGGQRVPGIARFLGSLSASFPVVRDIEGRLGWRVTGGYVPIGESDARTDAFSVLDLGVSIPLREGLFAELEVRNVLDEAYAEMRSSGYVNPGAPRSISLGFHYQGN